MSSSTRISPTHLWMVARAKLALLATTAAMLLATLVAPLAAQTLASSEVILKVSGGPDANGAPIDVTFSLADLQALPKTVFSTSTMWTEGIQTFEGVELKTLLNTLNVDKGTVIAGAINDYRVEIPVSEITAGGPMIAYLLNGAPMSVRDKGPLWIIYPYDSAIEFQTEVVFSRSIWQLTTIEIAP